MNEIEQGPIRPPSEAQSLLLRVTRNCSWNQCEFCHIYKGERFSARTVEEVKKDRPHVLPEGYRSVILWLHRGAKNVFLQDANNLALKTKDLVEMLTYLQKAFPTVERITTYTRARTIARKTLAEMKARWDLFHQLARER